MDNRSERPSSRGKPSLEEKIYRAPVINVVSMFSCLAVALVLLLAIIFFILGGSFLTDHGEDGTLYRYVGLMRGDVPYFGVFKGTDGTGGRISGDKVKFNDGSVYEGELRFLKFHGKGCFTDTYGNKFEGVYENGLLTGEGTVSYADGSSFNGNFSGGLFEGYGEITHADGSFSQYTYDLAGRLSTEVNTDKNGVVLQSYSYAYDAANNLVQKTETVGDSVKTTAYTYDAHNRVKTVTETGGKQTAYTYDKAGNRKTMCVTADGTTTQTTYTYNEQERLLNTKLLLVQATIPLLSTLE